MTDMPTTAPNPAELAEKCKQIAANYANACVYVAGSPRDAQHKTPYRESLHAAIDQLRDLASGPSAGAVVVAWLHEDGERSIAAKQKALAVADGGASAASVKPYNVPAYAAPAATPPAEKEVRAAAQSVITARLRFGWSPEVDEAIAVLEKAIGIRGEAA